MEENGKKIVIVIGAYLVAKSVLNLFLGGLGVSSLITLLMCASMAAVLICRVKYGQWIVGIVSILLAVYYLPGNLAGLPGTLVYLIEALLDIGASVVLFTSKDVKAYLNGGPPQF